MEISRLKTTINQLTKNKSDDQDRIVGLQSRIKTYSENHEKSLKEIQSLKDIIIEKDSSIKELKIKIKYSQAEGEEKRVSIEKVSY